MTEGIIQQVFRIFIEETHTGLFGLSQIDIELLQKELIEKIKQEYPDLHPFMHVYNSRTIRQKLIGDNNE